MHISFIHTPISLRIIEGRPEFWRNFDIRYHAVHPNSRPMKNNLWELPHWMIWLGGVLEARGFNSIEVLDFYTSASLINEIDEVEISNQIKDHPADIYLFSPLTPNLPYAIRIAEIIKQLHPKSINIFGGITASSLHLLIVENPNIDYVIVGRGEYALPALLNVLQNNGDLQKIGNLTFKNEVGQIISNNYAYPLMPLNQIPFPKINLFSRSVGADIRYIRQVYGLGCPHRCVYCSVQTNSSKTRYFHIDRVLSEIRAYRDYYGNHHHIYFGDETFTSNYVRTFELCSALKKEGDIFYDCQTRMDRLNSPKLFEYLYDSGCRWIELGIETVNKHTLDFANKHLKTSKFDSTLKRLRDCGIPACSYLMMGLPNETDNDMYRSIEWVCESIASGLLHASYLFMFVPYPGSDIFNQPQDFGVTIHHHNYELYHEDLIPVYRTKYMSSEQIYKVFLNGVKNIGQAMALHPHLGDISRTRGLDNLSSFWQGTP